MFEGSENFGNIFTHTTVIEIDKYIETYCVCVYPCEHTFIRYSILESSSMSLNIY